MAKNTVRMPQSTAGITSFSDIAESKIQFTPAQVIAIVIVVILVVALLHMFGRSFI